MSDMIDRVNRLRAKIEHKNKCRAIGCAATVVPTSTFCDPHWFAIPQRIRKEFATAMDYKAAEDLVTEAKDWIYQREARGRDE